MTLDANDPCLTHALSEIQATEAFLRAGGPNGRLSVERVHFSPKRPPLIRYRLESADGVSPIVAELVEDAPGHAEAERVRLAKNRRRQARKGQPVMVIADAATHMVFRPLGLDAKLPGLRWLADPDLARAALVEQGLAMAPNAVTTSLRAHRLGKRAVLQIDFRDGRIPRRIFARLRATSSHAGRAAFERHLSIAKALDSHAGLAVPKPLAFLDEQGIALFSAVVGEPLNFEQSAPRASFVQTLRAIAGFQSLDGLDLPVHTKDDELALLDAAIDRFASVFSALGDAARQSLAVLRRDFAGMSAGLFSPCHRDLHEEQVLISGDRVSILDFDTATFADPMLDFGNLLAHLRLAELREDRPADRLEALVEQASGARFDRHRLDIWRRAALLRLATVHGYATGGEALARRLIDEAGR